MTLPCVSKDGTRLWQELQYRSVSSAVMTWLYTVLWGHGCIQCCEDMAVYSDVATALWQGLKFLPVPAPVCTWLYTVLLIQICNRVWIFFSCSHHNACIHFYHQNWPVLQKMYTPEILQMFTPCIRPCKFNTDTSLSIHRWFSPIITALDTVRNYTTVKARVFTGLLCRSEIWPILQALWQGLFHRACNRYWLIRTCYRHVL